MLDSKAACDLSAPVFEPSEVVEYGKIEEITQNGNRNFPTNADTTTAPYS